MRDRASRRSLTAFTFGTADTSRKKLISVDDDDDDNDDNVAAESLVRRAARFLGRHTRQVKRAAGGGPLTAPRGRPSSQNTGYRLRNPRGPSHGKSGGEGSGRGSEQLRWLPRGCRSLSSIGAERRRWLLAAVVPCARSGWLPPPLLLLLGCPFSGGVRRREHTAHTGQCRGESTGRTRGRRRVREEREKERE